MATKLIEVRSAFSRFPGGRYVRDGKYSGEEFRERFLAPALRDAAPGDTVEVVLDGTAGYPSSFLEEAFGGLVRVSGFPSQSLLQGRLQVVAHDPIYRIYKELAYRFIRDAVAAPVAKAS